MEAAETNHHEWMHKINSIIDGALADMEVERARVDLSWITRYRTQLQSIGIALEGAKDNLEINEPTYIEKTGILTFLVHDIDNEIHGLRERYSNWDKLNTIQREEAMAEYFDRGKIVEYMQKLEDLAFRESLV